MPKGIKLQWQLLERGDLVCQSKMAIILKNENGCFKVPLLGNLLLIFCSFCHRLLCFS